MKKKLFTMIAVMTMVFGFVGCFDGSSYSDAEPEVETATEDSSMFVVVEESRKWSVVYHKETKVMYIAPHTDLLVNGSYKYGTFTIMLDSTGMPLLYEAQ